MSLDLFHERGTPLARQVFSWKELVPDPISKLDDDAFTRVRLILMHGVEQDACRFKHILSRAIHPDLRLSLAAVRRVEHHQATLINWMQPAEQTAIEVTAYVARVEPDPYIAQVHRFGMLEDFDHLYRFAALMDRVEGKDANAILQSYTDISPGRATAVEHRAPQDDLRRWYDRERAAPLTKLHAALLTSSEYQTRDYYLTIGPTFADPVARQLYAEIASIEEQHVTQYQSISDPDETWLEKWLVHEAMEAYAYWSCLTYERNPRVRAIWERFLDYELEHLRIAREVFEQVEGRDPASVIPTSLPDPLGFISHRKFVRQVLANEVDLRTNGTEFVPSSAESKASQDYRARMNRDGSPSESVAAGYRWSPGTELTSLLIPEESTNLLFKRASGA
jgi:hypothetical protein